MEDSLSSIENLSRSRNSNKFGDISISDELAGIENLRISALTRAAEISPLVKEVTIGPRSPLKKTITVQEKVPQPPEEVINLLEDKLGEDLRYTLLLKRYEARLQETSEVWFKNKVENMRAKHAEAMRSYWKKQSDDFERKSLELRARKLQMIKQLKENDNMSVLEKAKLDEQKCQLISRDTIENMNRLLEETNKATTRFALITDSHTKILIGFNEIMGIEQTEEDGKEIVSKYASSIQSILSNMSSIMDYCKTGQITEKEVKCAEILTLNIENLKGKIMKDLDTVRNKNHIRKQQEEETMKKEIEEQRTKEEELSRKEKEATEQAKKSGPLFYSPQNYTYYLELQQFLSVYENKYKELLEDASMKKFRFDCQKAVNTPVNTLSSVSGLHMKKTLEKLANLLRGERVQISDAYVSASQHPQGLYYCTDLLAKKIVRQGDLLVSSKPEAAFPLAAVTVVLWVEFPEFGKLLEAYFHKQCPYLVPMFLPQKQGQTDKDFYLSRGYTYTDDVVEKQDKFLKRMSGIFRLRCAIWIANTPSFIRASNPHGLRFGWQWLASFINLRPEPDICATLLHDFFTVCGSVFYKKYGRQFTKMIKLISTDYLSILQNIDEGGPKTRLEVFLQSVLQSGTIPPPSGVLPPNTW